MGRDIIVDIILKKSPIKLTEQEAQILRGAQVHEITEWLNYNIADWVQVSEENYTLTISKSTHKFKEPYVAQLQIISNNSVENNLQTIYEVTAEDSVVIYSDEPINCRIKIGGELDEQN